jgi:hypothetical protein
MLSEEPLRPQRSHSFIARNTSARVTRSQATMYSFSRIVMACISGSTIGKPWPVRPRFGARMLLWLLAWVVLRVDVREHPRADIVELNHCLFVHGHEVRGARP